MANDKWIEELADQLREHGSEVNPQLWQGISSQIGAVGSTGAAGGLGFAKIAAIVGISVSTVALTYFALNSSKEEKAIAIVESNQTESGNQPATPVEQETLKATPTGEKEVVAQSVQQTDKVVFDEEWRGIKENSDESANDFYAIQEIETPMVPEPILKNRANIAQPKPVEPIANNPNVSDVKKGESTSSASGVDPVVKQSKPAKFINLPNTFTPNGDGVNDEFFVETAGMLNYGLVIMDAKNNVVWKTDNPNDRWDGRAMNGDKCPNGNYIYFITAQDEAGKSVTKYQRLELQ